MPLVLNHPTRTKTFSQMSAGKWGSTRTTVTSQMAISEESFNQAKKDEIEKFVACE